MTLKVARSTRPGVSARLGAEPLVFLDDVAARERDDELLSVVGAQRRARR